MPTDIEIARAAKPEPIAAVGERLGIPADALLPYGKSIAKIETSFVEKAAKGGHKGKLILVTAINPTAAGEGKTTTTVGLSDALRQIGKRSAVAMREPSLGPCFGVKGGAAGVGDLIRVALGSFGSVVRGVGRGLRLLEQLLLRGVLGHDGHG